MPSIRKWLDAMVRWAALSFALCLVAEPPNRLAKPAPPELGCPFIRNFSPKEYGADSQNWALVQGPRGVIYAGNNQGVLAYDGARWSLIVTPGRTTVRSLGKAADGRVFVGAVGELGYLASDAAGRMAFVSLAEALPAEDRGFSDVWAVLPTRRGVLFQSREQMMLYADGRFQIWKAANTFHVAFAVGDRIFVRQRGVGLEELAADGRLALIPGGDRFAKESVFTMLPMAPPGTPIAVAPILVGSRNLGLWKLDASGLAPFPSGADAFLKAGSLYGGARLPDGTLALATIQAGVAILSLDGRLVTVFDRASGLEGDNVKFVFPDRASSLWLALDNGIAKVEWPSPFSRFDERSGLKGTVWAAIRHQGELFVATGQGAFRLDGAGSGPAPRATFQPITGANAQCLSFLDVEGHLLLANAGGVFEIRDGAARPVRPSGNVAISFCRSKVDPSRIFVGLQGGLASIRLQGSAWIDEGLIPGVGDDIYSIVEDEEGRLWLGTGAQGILRVTFPTGWKGGKDPAVAVAHFGVAQGLPSPNQVFVYAFGDSVVFATHAGVQRFNESSGRFEMDPRFANLFPDGPRWVKSLEADPQGRVWLVSLDEKSGIQEVGAAVPKNGIYTWDPASLRRISDTAIESIHADPDGVLWLGGPTGLIRADLSIPCDLDPFFPALIRSVTVKGGADLSPSASNTILPFARNALRFEFAAPGSDQDSTNHYQVFLEGYDHDWGPWTSETQKEFTNLHEGAYRFRIHAKNIYGRQGGEAAFAFRIRPPWYRTWWAIAMAFIGGLLLLGLGIRARTRVLQERNKQLKDRITEATNELREREQLLAHQAADLEHANLGLQNLNEQKNQYLGLVVHDLRNPLNAILLTAEAIEVESTESEIRGLASRIVKTGGQMDTLIGRFLDIAAVDAGTVKAKAEPCPLSLLIHEAIGAFSMQAAAKNISLRPEVPDTPLVAWVDPGFAREILANLISNAVKFSPPGKAVTLRLERLAEEAVLCVQDEGPGFTEDDKRRIFERFARLSAQPTAGESSVGLGLSLVKHMVVSSGGRIWVESESGQGAAFFVAFPLAPVD